MLSFINHKYKDLTLVISFALGLAISAQVSIPFYPVPFTLQTMIVTIAILYNPTIALKSMLVYLAMGIIGAPIFANYANAMVAFTSPHAGYLVGMLIAAAVIYKFNITKISSKIITSNIIIFSCGLIPLITLFGIKNAIYGGLLVFIAPEIIKTVMAYLIYRYIK
jgi:biotin transport system substrate-specific component